MLKKLRASLHEFFNPPALPVTPPPPGTPYTEWKPGQDTAARKLLKAGKPESLASLIESLPPCVSHTDLRISGRLSRGAIVYSLITGLDAAEVLQAFSLSPTEKKQQLLDETLAYTLGVQENYPHSSVARIEALRAAGAVGTTEKQQTADKKFSKVNVAFC